MVYGIIKLLNFAHGDLYMLGSFLAFVVLGGFTGLFGLGSIPILLLVLLITMLLTGGIGVLIERVAYRPLRSSPRLAALITAVGVSFTLEYACLLYTSLAAACTRSIIACNSVSCAPAGVGVTRESEGVCGSGGATA